MYIYIHTYNVEKKKKGLDEKFKQFDNSFTVIIFTKFINR